MRRLSGRTGPVGSARVLLALALTGAALVAGCAGDDDGGRGAGEPSSTTTVRFTGDAGSPFCGLLRDLQLEGVGEEEAATPASVEAGFTAVIDALGQVADAAPPELEEDTALVLAGLVALDDALRAVGYRYDVLAAQPELAVEVSRAANDPAFEAARARIERYRDQVCGL